MALDAATVSAISALAGSGIGALASVGTSWLTQHSQSRSQRLKQEAARRERLFSTFLDQASQAYADGIVQDSLDDPARLVPLYSTINKLRLFARQETIDAAEGVLESIVRTFEAPHTALRVGTGNVAAHDILRNFALASRSELKNLD